MVLGFLLLPLLLTLLVLGNPSLNAAVTGRVAEGAQIYKQHCAPCHGANGQGTRVGPSLQTATDPRMVIHRVRAGKGIMPAFAGRLTDAQIRAVAHYVARGLTGRQGLVVPRSGQGHRHPDSVPAFFGPEPTAAETTKPARGTS